jgi:Fe-S cluster biosynthesis and repair protein YggX
MTSLDERIAQFEHMAAEDPENDMAHFSLGSAYLQAGRPADAARSLERCVALNPRMSKAYQLAGEAQLAAGRKDRAAEILDRGYRVAARLRDAMPRDAIETLLRRIGREPPKVETADAATPGPAGDFVCRRTGRPGTQLAEPPMRGPVGQWIRENISAETWHTWIRQGTKVINELRLDFSREDDQRTYDEHMCEFLGIDADLYDRLRCTPSGGTPTTRAS